MAASVYIPMDGDIIELGTFLFCNGVVAVTLGKGGCLPHLILESDRRKTESSLVNATTELSFR